MTQLPMAARTTMNIDTPEDDELVSPEASGGVTGDDSSSHPSHVKPRRRSTGQLGRHSPPTSRVPFPHAGRRHTAMPPLVDVGAGDVDCGGDGGGDAGGGVGSDVAAQACSSPYIGEYPGRQTHTNPKGAVWLAMQ